MQESLFRSDLYDRLTFAEVNIPPLRHRREDIPDFIVRFISDLHEEIPNLDQKKFKKDTVLAMMDYYWPGNIRELKNVVERLYLTADDEMIMPSNLPANVNGLNETASSFHDKVEAYKKRLLVEALQDCNGKQSEVARKLEMSYDQFRHFFKKFCN